MTTKTPLIALSILAAAAFPVARADAKKLPRQAYFQLQFNGSQEIDWTKDETITSASCGVLRTTGNGTSSAALHTLWKQPVTVKRTGTNVAFVFPGKTAGKPLTGMPVAGSLERHAQSQGNVIVPPKPSACPKPLSIAPDCGRRVYPGGTQLSLLWDTPGRWPSSDGDKPHTPSLHVRGPYEPDFSQPFVYNNCEGENGDYQLGVITDPTPGYDSGAGALPLSTLFGAKKQFTVKSGFTQTDRRRAPLGATGGVLVHTTVIWSVRFKRLAKPGKPPGSVDPAPLT